MLENILKVISCHLFVNLIGGNITKWFIVCLLFGGRTDRIIDRFVQALTTVFDILAQVHIGLKILCNNGLKKDEVGPMGSHLHRIS